ncbi:MAG: hypothetical protein GF411_12995 [Candidatus Lokiarchaeota archaeon]|nr:hypothetical protein [Candidatus Lokiarchaeota archaeon]
MPRKSNTKTYLITGIFVFVLSIMAGIIVSLILAIPVAGLVIFGLPAMIILPIALVLLFFFLGWIFITIGGMRRRG